MNQLTSQPPWRPSWRWTTYDPHECWPAPGCVAAVAYWKKETKIIHLRLKPLHFLSQEGQFLSFTGVHLKLFDHPGSLFDMLILYLISRGVHRWPLGFFPGLVVSAIPLPPLLRNLFPSTFQNTWTFNKPTSISISLLICSLPCLCLTNVS